MNGSISLILGLLVALALDVSVSAGYGYGFRAEVPLLLALDAAALACVVVPAWLALRTARRLPGSPDPLLRRPRACIVLLAALPVLLFRLRRCEDPTQLWPEGLALAAWILLAWVEPRWRPPGTWTVLGAVGVAAGGLAWGLAAALPGRDLVAPAAPESAEVEPGPNVLLIVLDTLRADHVGLYGYPRATTPFLDEFGQRATVFENAISSSSWTLPAHATLFTGLYSRTHGADLVEDRSASGLTLAGLGRLDDTAPVRPLSGEAVTLAETVSEAGFETAAICANTAYLYRVFGLDQGFATYVDAPGLRLSWRPAGLSLVDRLGLRRRIEAAARLVKSNERYYLLADEVNRLATRWLGPRRDRRFFLFLNYMDPHEPYLPLGSYRKLFPGGDERPSLNVQAIRSGAATLEDAQHRALTGAYDGEIRYLDDQLRALFTQLEAWGLLEDTVVVIAGDHGESFGEHGELGHGNGVYQPEVRVPLIVRWPGQQDGRRVERPVHLVDVMPTLLEALGLPTPGGLQGTALDDPQRSHPVVTYTGRYHDPASNPVRYDRTHAALYDDSWKLILRSDGSRELYDLASDPEERMDRLSEQRGRAEALERRYERFVPEVEARFAAEPGSLGDEALERLRALGYVH